MGKTPQRWGHGRVVFMADLDAIRSELSKGVPMTMVYSSRSSRLGIGYSAFCKLVARYASDVRPKPVTASPAPTTTTKTETKGPFSVSKKPFATGADDPSPDEIARLTGGRPKR
jgi:hypothetical protein